MSGGEGRFLPVAARAYKVKHEYFGEVIYIDVILDSDGVRIYMWKCPECGASFKSLSLRQLAANVENHRRKHIDIEWGEGE